MWGLLRENSRLIEQFTSLAAAAGPLDNTDQLLQQVIVGFFFFSISFWGFESISNRYGNSKNCENGERRDDVPICHFYLVAKCSAVFFLQIYVSTVISFIKDRFLHFNDFLVKTDIYWHICLPS